MLVYRFFQNHFPRKGIYALEPWIICKHCLLKNPPNVYANTLPMNHRNMTGRFWNLGGRKLETWNRCTAFRPVTSKTEFAFNKLHHGLSIRVKFLTPSTKHRIFFRFTSLEFFLLSFPFKIPVSSSHSAPAIFECRFRIYHVSSLHFQ